VHLRRALLLFAIVLGLAALTASLSRPRDRSEPPPERSAPAAPQERAESAPGERGLTFSAGGPPRTRVLSRGRAATVTVSVDQAGQVSLDGLGLVAAAEPLTPASFPVHVDARGRYPVLFTPAGENEPRRVGTLAVR